MANAKAPVSSGLLPFVYQGENLHTFYKIFGSLENRTRRPLIVLHGGPGLSHDYLLPFSDLAVDSSIPVIFYDQTGNGESTHLREKPSSFWTIDLFIDELLNLVNTLGISDGFDIVGHSWGGILASELEVRRKPHGLRRLILTDTLASIELWVQSNMQLMAKYPEDVQEGLKGGMKDPTRYYESLKVFHADHGNIMRPPPKEYAYSLERIFGDDGDPTVAYAPILAGWTIVDRLDQVRVPTFVINGRADISQDFVVAPFFQNIPKVKWVTFEKSSHTPFWEERERYMQLVSDFLEW